MKGILFLIAKIRRAFNKPRVSVTQWTFTPTTPIVINNGSVYNLFSDAQFTEGSAQVVKINNGFGELFIAANDGEKSLKFDRLLGDEAVSIRCQIEFTFSGGATRAVEVSILRPTLVPKVAPSTLARLDNSYLASTSNHQTYAISETDNFYIHGAYPSIDNQSGAAMTITKMSILVTRIFEGKPV